jgi:hypothetical protein
MLATGFARALRLVPSLLIGFSDKQKIFEERASVVGQLNANGDFHSLVISPGRVSGGAGYGNSRNPPAIFS